MTNMKKHLILFLLAILIKPIFGQQLILKHYDSHEGLSSNLIFSLAQSSEGRLLIGTSSGLNSFDGQNFVNIKEFSSLSIVDLFVSSDSTVFISTIDSIGVFKNRVKRKVKFFTKSNGFSAKAAYTFFEVPGGKVLIGCLNGVLTFTKNKIIKEKRYSFLNDSRVYSITNDLQGNLYFATSKGLFKLTTSNINKKLLSDKIFKLFRSPANEIFARGKNGLYKKVKNKFLLLDKTLGAHNILCSMVTDYSGALILSKGENLYKFEKGVKVPLIDPINSPINSTIQVLFKDFDGKIWIGSNMDGLFKITHLSFIYYERHSGIKSNPFGILRTSSGELLVGTDGQGVLKFSPEKNQFVDAGISHIGKTVWNIFEDSEGNLWFAGSRGVFIKKKNGTIKYLKKEEGLPSNEFPINFFEDSAQNIWITTLGEYLYKYNGKNLSKVQLIKHGRKLTTYKILPDINYGYWLITLEGLYKFDGDKIINYKFKKELSHHRLYDAIFTKEGYLLLATANSGLILVDFKQNSPQKGVKSFTVKDGLPSNNIASIGFDKVGNLWVTTFAGISIIKNISSLFTGNTPDIITFGKNDIVLGDEFNQFSLFVDKDNSIWLGGVNKLVYHKPFPISQAMHIIKPYVKGVEINYKKIDPMKFGGEVSSTYSLPDNIVLPAFLNNLSFNLSAIDFSNPTYIKYSFKLEPINKKFSDYTSNSQIHFVGLPSGEYTLYIKAKDQYNTASSQIVKYRFTIKTPYYKNPYFIFLSLAILILLLIAFFHFRNRALRERNKELLQVLKEKKIVIENNERLSNEYKELFSSAYTPIIIIKRDTLEIIDANESASKLFGYSRQEFLKLNVSSFTKGSEKLIKSELRKISTLNDSNEGVKSKLFTKSGEQIDVEISIKSHTYKSQNCYVISIKDLSRENEIRRKLKEAKRLYDKNKELQANFLSQISHEIRSPLNSISGSAELLFSDLDENVSEESRILGRTILTSSKRIIRTLDLLLKQAQLNQGDYKPIFEEVKICDIVSQLFMEFAPEAEIKGLDLSYSCNPEYIVVNADYISVKTIISNFIENAVKYTEQGSVTISVYAHGNNVILEVADTGIGIDEEYLPYIFDSFSQEEIEVYTRKRDGNGLGLSVSKQYADLNKARIEIESKKGVGSKFKLIFHSQI